MPYSTKTVMSAANITKAASSANVRTRPAAADVMFPIPSERKLSVFEIAKYWSGEIEPPASAQDLRDVISKAWWCGELIAANGSSRLSTLRGYYSLSAHFIAFAIPDIQEAPQWMPNGEGEIELVRPLRVPLPNADPDTWTEANCASAFDALADQWNEAMISPYLILLDIVLTSKEFFQWVDAIGYRRPSFWANALERSDRPTYNTAPIADALEKSDQPSDNTVSKIVISQEQPKSKKSSAAWQAINSSWPDGPPEDLQTAHIHRQVNKWITKQLRTTYPFTKVSREVVARLLGRK